MSEAHTTEPTGTPSASRRATRALAHQRRAHEPPDAEVDEDGIGALVNNTGLDGDAPSG